MAGGSGKDEVEVYRSDPHRRAKAFVKNKNLHSPQSNCGCGRNRSEISMCFGPDDREHCPTLHVCATHPGPLPSDWYWLWTTWPRHQNPGASRHNSKYWFQPPWAPEYHLANQEPEETAVPARRFGGEAEEMEGTENEGGL